MKYKYSAHLTSLELFRLDQLRGFMPRKAFILSAIERTIETRSPAERKELNEQMAEYKEKLDEMKNSVHQFRVDN